MIFCLNSWHILFVWMSAGTADREHLPSVGSTASVRARAEYGNLRASSRRLLAVVSIAELGTGTW
jgi:hypothetical protein